MKEGIGMATNVNSAFAEFMKDKVNIEQEKTRTARSSRDNLIDNIKGFSGDSDFFVVYEDRILRFGSFERRTKIRPIDDVDLMLCLSSEGKRTYTENNNVVYINGSDFDSNNNLLTCNTNFLNSTKVINRFISKLSDLSDYSKSEMHKNQEAATLQLKSYTWNFDVVPCFYTDTNYYLIPDGNGNWKITDPRMDNEHATKINQKHNGNLLDLIRLIKYWNNRRVTKRIGSYLLECMILDFYESNETPNCWWIDIQFKDTLNYLSSAILKKVDDPKGIQGDLNTLNCEDKFKINIALKRAYKKAEEAINLEINDKDQKGAINKWREVLGLEFPKYTAG